MEIKNLQIKNHPMLKEMYDDAYYPDFLVDKIKLILLEMCHEIEHTTPADVPALLQITHAATERINDLEDEFGEHDSELETVAREVMAADFGFIVQAYGFAGVDIEDVIAPRDW